jgi:hypothetical protein
VEAILSRVSPSHFPSMSSETFSDLLQRRTEPNSPPDSQPHSKESHSSPPHRVALDMLGLITQELESSRHTQASTSGQNSTPMKDVPLAVLSVDEWRSLTRVCVRICVHPTYQCLTMWNTSLRMTIPTPQKWLLNS